VLDGLGVEQAHVIGLSMGGFATLHFGLQHPRRARSRLRVASSSPVPTRLGHRGCSSRTRIREGGVSSLSAWVSIPRRVRR
jgi:pimeloyl-ACP methyl ester carboxylesterase